MGGPDVKLETAGGLNMPDHPIGTDAVLVMEAIDRAWSDDGVLVLMDLGSAVLSAEMAIDLMPEERRANVLLCEAPIVEGAVAAAVTSKLGASLDRVAQEARGGLAGKVAHLGDTGAAPEVAPDAQPAGDEESIRLTVNAPHGLHARPAARFVQTASSFDARVTIRDLTNGRGPADAASLNGVAMLGATQGHEVEVAASGPQASEALAAIHALAERDFDDRPEPVTDRTRRRRAVARRAGRLGHRSRSPRLAGHRDRSRPAVPDARPADPRRGRGGRRGRARRVRRRARGRPGRDRAPARARRGDGDRRRGRDLRRAPVVPEGRRAPRADPGRDRGRRPVGRAGVARRDRTDGGAMGRARGRVPARASGRPPERGAPGARAPPRPRAPGTRARGARRGDRARPGARRHGGAGPVDGARDRHRRGRTDVARGRARAFVGDPGRRRRRRQRAHDPRGDAGRPGRVDGRGLRGSGGIGRVRAHRRARGARRGRPGGAGVGPRTGSHDRRRDDRGGGEHRLAGGRGARGRGRRRRRGPVPHGVPVHGSVGDAG